MKKPLIIALCVVVFGIISFFSITSVIAEQSGSSPNSGVASRLVTLVNDLITKGYGSVAAGSWGNWGDMWNRIYSAATWTPSVATYNLNASLGPANVPAGQTFYTGNDRTLQVGTGAYPSGFINQSLCQMENTGSPCTAVQEAQTPTASTWTNTVAINSQPITTQEVWRDDRTGLYWTEYKGIMANQYLASTCLFNTTTPRGNYSGNDIGVGNTECGPVGNAINYCATLSQVTISGNPARTNWYLPTFAELMQAYKDDMYNKAGTTQANANAFTTTNWFWSSSEYSLNNQNSGAVILSTGFSSYHQKYRTDVFGVHCVSRD